MPTSAENRSLFGSTYDWPRPGEEWSMDWAAQRYNGMAAFFPGISVFVPADTILEIAPRLDGETVFLATLCKGAYYRGFISKLH
jgi:hypothetical protein